MPGTNGDEGWWSTRSGGAGGGYPHDPYRDGDSAGDEVTPEKFAQIPWGELQKANEERLRKIEQKNQELETENSRMEQQLREEAWMCKSCKASFPKMLVRTNPIGVMMCPRCKSDKPGDIMRAADAIRESFQTIVEDLQKKVAALTLENDRLKQEIARRRLSPGQPRTVEEA